MQEQRGVAVAEEAVVAGECVVIHGTPVAVNKCRYEQQQCRAWLVEVGYNTVDNLEFITRRYYYARRGYKGVGAVLGEVAVNVGKGLFCCEVRVLCRVRIPLRHFSVPFPLPDEAAYVVKAFEGAYRCGAYGYDPA